MALYRVFPLSQRAQILIIRRFYCVCQFSARVNSYFQLLTYHYIARATLVVDATKCGNLARFINHSFDVSKFDKIWPKNSKISRNFFSFFSLIVMLKSLPLTARRKLSFTLNNPLRTEKKLLMTTNSQLKTKNSVSMRNGKLPKISQLEEKGKNLAQNLAMSKSCLFFYNITIVAFWFLSARRAFLCFLFSPPPVICEIFPLCPFSWVFFFPLLLRALPLKNLRFFWVTMSSLELLWVPLSSLEFPRVPLSFLEFPWIAKR